MSESRDVQRETETAVLNQISEGVWLMNDSVITGGYIESADFKIFYRRSVWWDRASITGLQFGGAWVVLNSKLKRAAKDLVWRVDQQRAQDRVTENTKKLQEALARLRVSP